MKLIIFFIALFTSINAMAAGSVTYNCVGKNFQDKNSQSRNSVVFNLLFSDHARGAGYTNQSVILNRIGWDTLEEPIVLQMFDATSANECQKNSMGEIQMSGESFSMDPSEVGSTAPYLISFKINCGQELNLDVKAYCFFE